MADRKDDFIVTRTTTDLKKRVKKEADMNNVTLSKEVRNLLEDGLKFRQLSRG